MFLVDRFSWLDEHGDGKMAVAVNASQNGRVIAVTITGKLERAHYDLFVPELEDLIATHGKIRMLVELKDFHGWTAGALWEDLKFDVKHFRDIERLAIVGETKWQKGMAWFCTPFTTAEIRYFDPSAAAEARQWIERA